MLKFHLRHGFSGSIWRIVIPNRVCAANSNGMSEKSGRRKLLTAAVGVATISYVYACDGLGGGETSGNLVAPPDDQWDAGDGDDSPVKDEDPPNSSDAAAPRDAGLPPTSGNLVAPPEAPDAGEDSGKKDAGSKSADGSDAGNSDAGNSSAGNSDASGPQEETDAGQ